MIKAIRNVRKYLKTREETNEKRRDLMQKYEDVISEMQELLNEKDRIIEAQEQMLEYYRKLELDTNISKLHTTVNDTLKRCDIGGE